jgi:hypothetical protein
VNHLLASLHSPNCVVGLWMLSKGNYVRRFTHEKFVHKGQVYGKKGPKWPTLGNGYFKHVFVRHEELVGFVLDGIEAVIEA